MTEDEARALELVRAVEIEDRDGTLLTREDRAQADAHARCSGEAPGPAADARFLARRATFAAARLTTRHPGIAALLRRSRGPRWLALALPPLALVAGFVANEFGTGRRLELLAVPLLGTIAWNLAVFVWIALSTVTGKSRADAAPLLGAWSRMPGAGQREIDRGTPLHRAANAFHHRWASLSAPLAGARIARTLHLSAALFAAGLIGGIYLRALVIEYRAGWESTFLDPTAVRALLSTVLGPASVLTNIAIPPVSEIAAMRWTGPAGSAASGGVNAGPWIHLYTVTVAALVIAPRLLLAGWQAAKAAQLSRRFPAAGREDFYIRRLLRGSGGRAGGARITPYAYRPGDETQRRLGQALRDALGEGARVRFDDPIEYGAEDAWLASHALDPADDYHVLLFTMSATPEAENHGALAAALSARIAKEYPGTVLSAVLDESPFRAHFAGQSGLEARIDKRVEGWRAVLAPAGIAPLAVDLSHGADETLLKRLESGLIGDGALRG